MDNRMSLAQHALALSVRQVDAVTALIAEMRPPLDPPGRPQCALFLTIAEQFDATVCLARANLLTHGAVHVRSMIEATADLFMLGLRDNHVRRMQYEEAYGAKRFYERLLESHQLTAADREMIEANLAECVGRYTPLHEEFKKDKLYEVEKFTATELPEFIGIYSMLCSFVHNDLTALSLRHQRDTPGMIFRAPLDDGISFLILQAAQHAMVRSVEYIGEIAWFPPGHFEQHRDTMHRLYRQLVDSRPLQRTETPA